MKMKGPILFTCAAALFLLFAPDSGRDASSRDSGSAAVEESPEQLKYFYEMRLYGDPDIDPYQRLWQAALDPRVRDQFSMKKSNLSLMNQWECAGPVNISGRVRALAVHPADNNVIYAATATGGVWKTTNSGADWFPMSDNTPALASGAIAIDPFDPNTIYVGTGEPIGLSSPSHSRASPAYSGVGVLKSTDAGGTWELLPWSSSSSMIHRIALHPENSDTVMVASTSGLLKSTNAGRHWSSVLSGTVTELFYAPGRPSRIYAALGNDNGASSNGVYVSDAGGKNFSWVKLTNNLPRGHATGRIIRAVAPSDPNRLYAAVALRRGLISGSNGFFMVCVSSDGGETWQRRPGAIPRNFTNYMPYYCLAMKVSPVDPDFVMLGSVDWWRSTNGGLNFVRNTDWSLRTSNPNSPRYVHADQHDLVFKPGDPNTMIVASDGGVHLSTNKGDTWTMRTFGMITTQYYGVTTDPSVPYKLYGGTQDQSNQRQSAPGDKNWSFLGGGDGCSVAVDPQVNSNIFVVINGTPQRSINSGASFQSITNGFDAGASADRDYWWRPMAFHPGDRSILYISSQYMYKMRNPASGTMPVWQIISPDLTRGSVISDFHVPDPNKDWMYVVTGDGKAWRTENIKSSEPTWIDISAGLPARWLPRITADPEDHMTAFVAVSGYGTPHMYKTTDAGASWVNINGDFPDIPVGALYRSPHRPDILFAASDMGVWYSSNNGENWLRYGDGLPNCIVYDMVIAPDGKLVAGTYGRGIWLTSSVLSAPSDAAPVSIELGVNHPNPFRKSTRIPFTLDRSGIARLTLFDASGRFVRTLADEHYEAGAHGVRLDAGGLAPGVYYCTLESGGKRLTRKLTLLR